MVNLEGSIFVSGAKAGDETMACDGVGQRRCAHPPRRRRSGVLHGLWIQDETALGWRLRPERIEFRPQLTVSRQRFAKLRHRSACAVIHHNARIGLAIGQLDGQARLVK